MVREADSSMCAQGLHPKLVHDHYTVPPWVVTALRRPSNSLEASLNGRKVRRRVVSMSSIKVFHACSKELRHDLEDEFAHPAWESDLGLPEASVIACALLPFLIAEFYTRTLGVGIGSIEDV